ncbi:MAG: transcription-repair coupling factor [Verrucomicrobiales bacterium]|nr:transcription-repair coupling factor [Verrucomicrobiales bacterium]
MGHSSGFEQAIAQLARSKTLSKALKRVSQATPVAPVRVEHFTEAGQPFLAASVVSAWREQGQVDTTVWMLCPNIKAQEILFNELSVWGIEVTFLPEYEWAGFEESLPDPESAAERLAVLKALHEEAAAGADQVVVLTKDSLDEPAPVPGMLHQQTEAFSIGSKLDIAAFTEKLEEAGYEREPQVFQRGQFALRGGIIDVFSWQAQYPFRIELFDDDVESIREFDLDSQTSIQKIKRAEILLSEANLEMAGTVSDYIRDCDLLVDVNSGYEEASVQISSEGFVAMSEDHSAACYGNPVGMFEAGDFILQEQKRTDFLDQLAEWRRKKWRVLMAFHSDGEKDRFTELVYEKAWDDNFLIPIKGGLSRGFTIPDAKLAVLSDAEIFGRYQNQWGRKRTRLTRQRQASQQVSSLREFGYGDMVVHIDYGIGKFRGIKTKTTGEKEEDVLEIEYDEEARLYVPLNQAHLVSRYVGTGKKAPKLSKLGDKRWGKIRRDAENSIMDYAARLLTIQAERETHVGQAHKEDNRWQWEFENAFIYKETPDQLRAIEETKRDMESAKPMDRLICGDVGFGKTEIAIRAAFKAVMSGKQVAFLAPTTVLADQHFHNLRERMSDFPVAIAELSRYRSPREQRETIAQLASGGVDIVIGTHRLLSKQVQFKDLGLVIIDEEQRFGVKQKEEFKERWRFVDVLTLSATPIPRTLYLSLMGVREMSAIDTPPTNRRPVATTICPYDEKIIKTAIEKELARQGQIFFLHNRVKTIRGVQRRIEELVPGVRVRVGHGQMDDDELEEVMKRFINHEFDVLVCTTIIESGVDIPNANTIMIDRADRFGLADLYQIRGRVGRADRRAYAYLMLPPDMLTVGDARKRINAIKQYSSLGAGFKIAMRDLEIRGAGNLLGTKQSGHIAAIGFDLYCQLLKQSVASLKGEVVKGRIETPLHVDFICTNESEYLRAPQNSLPAYIPAQYMPEARLRITAYRELAEASSTDELEELRENWEDRFGKIPPPVEFLLQSTEIKILAAERNCSMVELKDGKLRLTRNGNYVQINGKFPRLYGDNPEEWLESAKDWIEGM